MKKIAIGLVAVIGLTSALTGCSNPPSEKSQTEQKQAVQQETIKATDQKTVKLGDHVDFLGLIITFEKATYLENDKGVKNSVMKIDMKVENKSAASRGFTTIDMEIKDSKGKKLAIYPGENLGEKIKPGKSISGSGYFTVNGNGPYTITYKDQDSDKKASWEVEVK
ncbi:hypothetical protein PGRAN_06251 [Listeria grandensis FSL F6-0971]|uniref:DUF4352 domain-containing protein n=1 Tax=Listeria grandensis FSL F6-0971 TaxID=1265819 RepID=W7BUD2_9LIST|nr:DUF4352 domain-containing protein [Listeria grandensis]EUJ23938.1 hypothetical protein PGRAN_06251 [Listeria grandensis FSL F6-0971]